MSKNITYQLTSSVDAAFCKTGGDKHSDKKQGVSIEKVYSYAERKNLIDMSFQFGRYMIENFPEIRKVKDIKIDHVNSFLQSKTNVTQATMTLYKHLIHKLEILTNKKFHNNVDWHTGLIIPKQEKQKIRTCMITQAQVDKLVNYLDTRKDSASKNAVLLSLSFALRVGSIAKLQARDVSFIDNNKCILHIHEDKGKRSRDILVDKKEDIELLRKIVGNKRGCERLIPIRSASINTYLRRCFKNLGFTNLIENKTSIHSIRKYSITKYVSEKEQEVGRKKALELAMQRLGHGKERNDLKKIYILK